MSQAVPKRGVVQPDSVMRYRIPAGEAQGELLVKRSTFLATVGHASSVAAAREYISRARAARRDAHHHAWAFRLTGGPHGLMGSSDDGEPGGTAGRPILAVLEASGLREVVAVVARRFGGIKLGTGGLVRAYGRVVREALGRLATAECVLHRTGRITVGYRLYASLEHVLAPLHHGVLARCGVIVEETTFAKEVTMLLAVPYESARQVADALRDMSSGQIALDQCWLEDRYYVIEGRGPRHVARGSRVP